MSIVYLCIGTMKTGTTALQNFMRNNPAALKKQGFCYPYMNMGSIRRIRNRNAHFMIHRPEHKNDNIQQRCYQKLQRLAKTYPNIVLSEELIWHHSVKIGHFWPDVLEKVNAAGCQLKVIVYLRRQDDIIQSLWNQSVKLGWRLSVTFEDYIRLKKYRYFPLDYYKQLKNIEEVIGKENLIVRVYENGQFEGEEHTLISDFMQILGLRMTDGFMLEERVRNPSLSGNFLEMKRIINSVPEYKNMTEDFMAYTIQIAGFEQNKDKHLPKQSFFSYKDQLAFLERYAESNRKVAEEYLGREDGILFREPVEELPLYQVDQETLLQDMLVLTTALFCKQQQKIDQLEEQINKQLSARLTRFYKRVKNRLKKMAQKALSRSKNIFRSTSEKEMV